MWKASEVLTFTYKQNLHFSYLSITPEDSTQFANKEIEIK